MIRFLDGPAVGVSLACALAPKFLRVVQKPDGTFDALGLALDVPGADEEITVYVLHEQQGSAHLSYTDARGRRCGRWEACASYRLHSTQPEDATARDNFAWRKWCAAQDLATPTKGTTP